MLANSSIQSMQTGFETLNLINPICQALHEEKYILPTPIQEQAIPYLVKGRDLLGCAQTGTGKTAAFALPILQWLEQNREAVSSKDVRSLILAPTRELAVQIGESFRVYGRHLRIKQAVIYGGVRPALQIRALSRGVDILVATPGRLLDLLNQRQLRLDKVGVLVLDEADRMLDMGFAPQLNQILDALPDDRQTLLFSATMPSNLGDLARMSLKDPVRAMVAKSATPAEGVNHMLHYTTPTDKTQLLLTLLREKRESVLVFTRTKHRADRLGETLDRGGHRVAVLHGGRRLTQRRSALEGFRRGRFQILVATDVAARGLDVANIGHVVNYDLPNVPEDLSLIHI